MQASINRSVARSKEVVYDITCGEDTLFRSVIVENNKLLILYPRETITPAHQALVEKLLTKAKHRDGISSHTVMTGHVLKEAGKELLVEPAPQETIV